ncbi:PorT family protein [Mucilaginibacter sp. Bleaf8]|uniref:porin family protein n=1 Tax=Mucilaginibacter sp. Bleaf8 TaxID=2834430 RepID=UPI001BD18958|nr:porin family protein [Mucilaginibacter sp. Bleaf8]MBS7563545.1 PorT family protein [Mucilaginibacter sp. Bleaf8]
MAAATFASFAQSKTVFGVKAGVNFAKFNTESTSPIFISDENITSFLLGIYADQQLGGNFTIQPGLFFTGKGGGSVYPNGYIRQRQDTKTKLHYLQIPVNIVYNIPSKGGIFFFGVGPYAAYNLSGNVKENIDYSLALVSNVVDIIPPDNDLRRGTKKFDFGATGLAGFKLKSGFSINVNYDLGLSNITPDYTPKISMKNRVWGISFGYEFK